MGFLRSVSIKQKMIIIMAFTTGMALLIMCAALVIEESVAFRRNMVRDLSAQADIIGANSTAALTFDDPDAARETLAALRDKPNIIGARIYTASGAAFAAYDRGSADKDILPARAKSESFRFNHDNVVSVRRIVLDGETIGMVAIESDTHEIYAWLISFVRSVAVALPVSFLLTLLLSAKFQSVISEPILRLACAARAVSSEKNYAVRVEGQGNDELGVLIDGFNEMLTQIERRDAALQDARDHSKPRCSKEPPNWPMRTRRFSKK